MTRPCTQPLPSTVALVRSRLGASLTFTLATGLLGAVGCASEPERPPPPRPAPAPAEPAGPVAAASDRPRAAVGPAGATTPARPAPAPARPAPAPARPAPPPSSGADDELPPPLPPTSEASTASRRPTAGDELGETDAQRIARLEREAARGSSGGGGGLDGPARSRRSAPDDGPERAGGAAGGRLDAGRGGDAAVDASQALTLDKELDALLQRANQAVGKGDWPAYAGCFSRETQGLLAASWGMTIGVSAWTADQRKDQNSRGVAKILWLRSAKSGITRQSILDVVEGRTTPRAAIQALREARRDPKQTIGELGPALPFSGNRAFLAAARIQAARGKGAGATATVQGPEGTTVLELQHGDAGGFVLHVKDIDAWVERSNRILTARIAAKE